MSRYLFDNRDFGRVNKFKNIGDIWDIEGKTTKHRIVILYVDNDIIVIGEGEQGGMSTTPASERTIDITDFKKLIIKHELTHTNKGSLMTTQEKANENIKHMINGGHCITTTWSSSAEIFQGSNGCFYSIKEGESEKLYTGFFHTLKNIDIVNTDISTLIKRKNLISDLRHKIDFTEYTHSLTERSDIWDKNDNLNIHEFIYLCKEFIWELYDIRLETGRQFGTLDKKWNCYIDVPNGHKLYDRDDLNFINIDEPEAVLDACEFILKEYGDG